MPHLPKQHDYLTPLCAGILSLTLASCSSDEPDSPAKSANGNDAAAHTTNSPHMAVRRVLDGLQAGHIRPLWDFLPPSFQADIQRSIREAAGRVDEDHWKRIVAEWQKARRVLSDKRAAILKGREIPPNDVDQRARGSTLLVSPDALGRILDILGDSEFADLARLRTIDVGSFLDKSGDPLLKAMHSSSAEVPGGNRVATLSKPVPTDSFGALAVFEVTLVSESAATARVRIGPKSAPHDATEYEFVLVEDHWLPKSLVDAWPAGVDFARALSFRWLDGLRDNRDEWQARLADIDRWLDELGATTTDDAARQVFENGLTAALLTFAGNSTSDTSTDPQPDSKPQTPPATKPKRSDTEELLPDRPK